MSISPSSVNAFVAHHAHEYSSMIGDEMKSAQDRATLMRDVASLTATLQASAGTQNWAGAHAAIDAFIKDHPDVAMTADFSEISAQTKAWADGGSVAKFNVCAAPSDGHPNYSFEGGGPIGLDDARKHMDMFIGKANAWKDKIGGDDKLAMMSLTQHAEDLKNIYQMGSNLNAALNQPMNTIVGNIKG